MDPGQHRGGGGFGQDKLRLGGHGGQLQGALLKLDFLALQKQDGQPAIKEKRGGDDRELIGGRM